jgi:hypothetical protein
MGSGPSNVRAPLLVKLEPVADIAGEATVALGVDDSATTSSRLSQATDVGTISSGGMGGSLRARLHCVCHKLPQKQTETALKRLCVGTSLQTP